MVPPLMTFIFRHWISQKRHEVEP